MSPSLPKVSGLCLRGRLPLPKQYFPVGMFSPGVLICKLWILLCVFRLVLSWTSVWFATCRTILSVRSGTYQSTSYPLRYIFDVATFFCCIGFLCSRTLAVANMLVLKFHTFLQVLIKLCFCTNSVYFFFFNAYKLMFGAEIRYNKIQKAINTLMQIFPARS